MLTASLARSLGNSGKLPVLICCCRGWDKPDIQLSSSLFLWRHEFKLGFSEKYISLNMFPEIIANSVTLVCGVSSSLKSGSCILLLHVKAEEVFFSTLKMGSLDMLSFMRGNRPRNIATHL